MTLADEIRNMPMLRFEICRTCLIRQMMKDRKWKDSRRCEQCMMPIDRDTPSGFVPQGVVYTWDEQPC